MKTNTLKQNRPKLDFVSTRKYNKHMVKAIVTKTGNSYALRVPKHYIDDNQLELGDVVEVEDPLTKQRRALQALIQHGKKHGPIKGIPDPVAWQRQQRASSDPWEEIKRDSAR
jgi:putative transposon-encoded protein